MSLLGVGSVAHSQFITCRCRLGEAVGAEMRTKKHPVVRKIESEVENVLAHFGYELVQIKFGGGGGGRTLTVLMDSPDGITAEDCQEMSRRFSLLLDMLDPITGAYTLVVSSPGLDRPLTRDGDFERFKGERAAVSYCAPGGRRTTERGLLRGVAEHHVLLEVEGGPREIPLADVEEAHLVYDWDAETA